MRTEQKTQQEKQRPKPRPTPWTFKILLGILVVISLLLAGYWFKDKIINLLVEAVKVQYSRLENTEKVEFLVIREEAVVSAPYPGSLELVSQEGERIPKGGVVAYLRREGGTSLEKEERYPLCAGEAGILSFFLDGYESVVNLKNWSELNWNALEKLEERLEQKPLGDAREKKIVAGGTPVFKIVNNLAPTYLYFTSSQKAAEKLKKGSALDVRLDHLDNQLIRGTIHDIVMGEGGRKILLQVPSFNGGEKLRRIKGLIVLDKHDGVVVPENVLVTKNGSSGVYVLRKSRAVWQEVKILAHIDNKVALDGLNPGEWIISTPGLVREGQQVTRYKE